MLANLFLVLGMTMLLVYLMWAVWRVYTKAGKPGWASLVPIYNLIVMLQIEGKPWWWMVLLFVPFVNFFVSIAMAVWLAKAFGKGTGFGIGLAFLPFVFYPVLAFGEAEYVGGGSPHGGYARAAA